MSFYLTFLMVILPNMLPVYREPISEFGMPIAVYQMHYSLYVEQMIT